MKRCFALLAAVLLLAGCAPPPVPTAIPTLSPEPVPSASVEAILKPTAEVTDEAPLFVIQQYGKYGVVNAEGIEVFPCEYSRIGYAEDKAYFSLTRVEGDTPLTALGDRTGRILTPWVEGYIAVQEGYALLSDETTYALLDLATGETVRSWESLSWGDFWVSLYGGRLQVQEADGTLKLWYMEDLVAGQEDPSAVIAPRYAGDELYVDVYDCCLVAWHGYDGKYRLLDRSGVSVDDRKYDALYPIFDADDTIMMLIAEPENGGRQQLITAEGDKVMDVPEGYLAEMVSENAVSLSYWDAEGQYAAVLYDLKGRPLTPRGMVFSHLEHQGGLWIGCVSESMKSETAQWYVIAPDGTPTLLCEDRAYASVMVSEDTLVIHSYEDAPQWFDRATLAPLTHADYAVLNPTWYSYDAGGRAQYYWEAYRQEGDPFFDLLDRQGQVLLSEVNNVWRVEGDYALVIRGFDYGIIRLSDGQWTWKTSRFSELIYD